LFVDARGILIGEGAEVTHQAIGRLEAVDIDDLGGEDGRGGSADSWDGDDLQMSGSGQIVMAAVSKSRIFCSACSPWRS